ncbi:MAG: SusD/RagB family nutrient-binding outer membrane lipoprotein [Parafilimonas sp.]
MRYLNKKLLFAIAIIILLAPGCSKNYLDVNNDPNRVTGDNITPELVFTQAAVTTGIRMVGGQAGSEGAVTDIQFAENWVGYMSGTGDYASNGPISTYNLDFTFADNSWKRDYALLADLYAVKTKALVANGDTVLAGAAIILSAKVWQEMVDAFGDIPYSQAFQPNTYSHPVYDKAQDIYNSLLLSLDTAINYMRQTAPSSFAATDVVNSGDQSKWIHFANTLKLRLLIRQSEIAGFDPSVEINKIQSNGGVLGAGESVSVNPGYSNSQAKQSPFYGNYGYTSTGNAAAQGWGANNYILSILQANSDPRIARFFTLSSTGGYLGGDFGLYNGNPTSSQISYFGDALVRSADQDQWIYPSYESLFLKAEAIARGWMSGDAKTAFEDAITESFVWLGVPDAENAAAAYITDNPDITDWSNAGSSADSKDKFVVYQKYIANTCIDPRESWADQRRLYFLPSGFISNDDNRISNTLPLRLPYAQSEYTTNAESVLKEGTVNIFSSKIFWEP